MKTGRTGRMLKRTMMEKERMGGGWYLWRVFRRRAFRLAYSEPAAEAPTCQMKRAFTTSKLNYLN